MNSTIYKSLCAIALSSSMAFSASAEIINSDWKTAGDGLTFTDESTGLVFLDLNRTAEWSVKMVSAALNSTFEGFAFATPTQVVTALTSALANHGGYIDEEGTSSMPTSIFINPENQIMGIASSAFGYGLVFDEVNKRNTMYGYYTSAGGGVIYRDYGQYSTSFSSYAYSVWLVKSDSVSNISDVPAPLAFSSLALLGFGLVRRKKSAI